MIFGNGLAPVTIPGHMTTYRYQGGSHPERLCVLLLKGAGHTAKDVRSYSCHGKQSSDATRASLDQAGFQDVSVSQGRDNGVITLGGRVSADSDKKTWTRLSSKRNYTTT